MPFNRVELVYEITATIPLPPSTRMRCPVTILRTTSGRPATAGRPNSRATIAPCDGTPPVSIIRPFARANSGIHDGSVGGLAEQLLGVIAAQRTPQGPELIFDATSTIDHQARRVLRPL